MRAVSTDRTEIYHEPVRGGYGDFSVLGLSGLERMRAGMEGLIPPPPIHHLTGLKPTDTGYGSATFTMPASPWLQSGVGPFLGATAFLADAPVGTAVFTTLPPGEFVATSEFSMSYLRPASVKSGTLIAKAKLIHAGRLAGLAEVSVEDGQGRLLSHATSRLVVQSVPAPERPELKPIELPDYDTLDPYLRPVEGGVVPQGALDQMSGLDAALAWINGKFPRPPISHLMGIMMVEAEEGAMTWRLPVTEWLHSPAGAVYGGAIAAFAEIVMMGAAMTTIPARTAVAPLDMKVNFLRPLIADGSYLIGKGRVVHKGRRIAVVNVDLTNAEGKSVAMARGSTMILPDRPMSTMDRWTAAEEGPETDTSEA